MKRRETKSWEVDAGRSPLVRACSRWLSFARGLSQGRRPTLAAADTLAFIESLYGGKFTTVEGGALSLDKVYRTAGGGLFISETRLSLSVHPRFDLRLLSIAGGSAVSQVFRESPGTTTLLSRSSASGREQRHDAWHITNSVVTAPSLTVQTWNVLPASVERARPAFGYVSVRGQRAQQTRGFESARLAVRVERVVRSEVLTPTSAETSHTAVTTPSASLRLTSLDLRRLISHAPQQEFVSLLLNTYLPAVVSREVLSVTMAGGLSGASARWATAQGATERYFASTLVVQGRRRPAAWTYAESSTRHAPGGAVEIRREFRAVETLKEQASAHDARPPLLHLLPPASLLLSLSETSLTVFAGAARHITNQLSGRAPAQLLQLHRTHTAAVPLGARKESAAVDAPRLLDQPSPRQITATRDVLSSLNTLEERVHSTVADITHVSNSTLFARPGFDSTLRRGFARVSARQRGVSSETTPGHATSPGLFGRSVEFVRLASAAVSTRNAATHNASMRTAYTIFSTQGAPGAGTFLFATGLLRRSMGISTAGVPSQAVAAESERALSETRAARPEGMALELVQQRREEVLRLPQPGYVYTQPARAQLEERQVITKASREEIVEVVRKEVRSLTASTPARLAPSRAELAGIADEVYSTLVRRLLVEKERLGRF